MLKSLEIQVRKLSYNFYNGQPMNSRYSTIFIFSTLVALIIYAMYLLYSDDSLTPKDRTTLTKKLSQEKQNSTTTPKKPKPLHQNIKKPTSYKEIFKEPQTPDILDELRVEKELKEMEEEANKIIQEADSFIETNNLILPQKELTEEEKKEIEKLDSKLKRLTGELESLKE
jgi:hypothetical protein